MQNYIILPYFLSIIGIKEEMRPYVVVGKEKIILDKSLAFNLRLIIMVKMSRNSPA